VTARLRDELREQIALAQVELSEAKLECIDVEGILGFAEYLLENAPRLWMELSLEQRQQLQRTIFPEGLPFDGEQFGTAVTCLAFKNFGGNWTPESGMASQSIGSWNQISAFLSDMQKLKELFESAA